MRLFGRRKKERRAPTQENQQHRQEVEQQRAVTDPELRVLNTERVKRVIDRAKELADIASVVTIRTNPKRH